MELEGRSRLLLVVVRFVDGASAPAEGTLCTEDVCIYTCIYAYFDFASRTFLCFSQLCV